MKTVLPLANGGVTYQSGKKAWAGAIKSYYAGTYHEQCIATPQSSSAGKILLPSEENIRSFSRKLEKGRIGATKDSVDSDFIGNTKILQEAIAEVNNLDEAQNATLPTGGKTFNEHINEAISYTTADGKQVSYSEVLETRKKYRDHNQKIQAEIDRVKELAGYKPTKGKKMPEKLFSQIKNLSQKKITITGFDLKLTIKREHTLMTNKDFVICSDEKEFLHALSRANYVRGNRLVGKDSDLVAVVPIQTVQQIKQIARLMEKLFSAKFLTFKGRLFVASETRPVDGIDLEVARACDKQLSSN